MMKTLVSSSSRVLPGKCREKWFPSPMDAQIRFLHHKLVDVSFLRLISVQRKPFLPISSSSSSEPQAELDTAETEILKKSRFPTVHVRLQLQKQCSFGEQFFVVGDDPMFGLWKPSGAIPLSWSDDHVWTAELEIPIGKLIQFKFILKGMNGTILWQPGPDRILRTWATDNTITVIEDWDDAELQKITEGPVSVLNEESAIYSDTMQDVTRTKDMHMSDHPQAQEKPMAMVAENITYPQKELLADSNGVLQRETAPIKNLGITDLNGNLITNEEVASIKNLGITDLNGNLITNEEGPVLVPGLTPLSALPTEETRQDRDKRSISMDASAGAMEAKDQTLPELDDKQEPEGEPNHKDTMEMVVNDEKGELQDTELEQKNLAKEDEMDSNSNGNGLFGNDTQWGHRTLQKLLTNLGFPTA